MATTEGQEITAPNPVGEQLLNSTRLVEIKDCIQHVYNAFENERVGGSGLVKAHLGLLNAIQQLLLAAETPMETAARINFQPTLNYAVRVALAKGFLQALVDGKGEGEGEREKGIAAATFTTEELLAGRLLRCLSAAGICDEVDEDRYKANEVTKYIVAPGGSGAVQHHFDMVIPVLSRLVEDIRQNKLDQFPMMPGQVSPFQYTHQMPTWEWYARHKSDGEAFDNYMSDRREYHWYDMFPVGLLDLKDPSSVLLVDVGGGRGHDLQGFQRRYPHLKGRFILQDLSRVINSLDNSLEGIERMAYDFFESQPVQGAQMYFFRNILHCLSDEKCAQVLSNTVKAMDKDRSILVIDELVLPKTKTGLRPACMDILMMLNVGAMERKESQWRRLLNRVGLEITEIYTISNESYESIIVTRRKDK